MQVQDIVVKPPVAAAKAPRDPVAKAPALKAAVPALQKDRFEPAPKAAQIKAAKVARKAPPSPSAKVPGEEVRNTLSIAGQVVGPVVTAEQTLGILSAATFKNPLFGKAASALVHYAGAIGKLPLFRHPAVHSGVKLMGRAMPFLSAGILAFDAFAFVKTIANPEASGMRKFLTTGRFIANAVATGVSFIPGAGFVYALAPALVGNVFEFGLMKLNKDEAKQAAK